MKYCPVARLIKRLKVPTLITLVPWSEVWAWHRQQVRKGLVLKYMHVNDLKPHFYYATIKQF